MVALSSVEYGVPLYRLGGSTLHVYKQRGYIHVAVYGNWETHHLLHPGICISMNITTMHAAYLQVRLSPLTCLVDLHMCIIIPIFELVS